MNDQEETTAPPGLTIPPDDLRRHLALARPEADPNLPHLGIVGGTYTILLTGKDAAGRYCLIEIYIPPSGGPPPHRHDFEESFTVTEGELEATFRGGKLVVRAGETISSPANAPHQFNGSGKPVRLLCICSPRTWRRTDGVHQVQVPWAWEDTFLKDFEGQDFTGRHFNESCRSVFGLSAPG
jgi:quercetin dioxygenase-like cupin family protein